MTTFKVEVDWTKAGMWVDETAYVIRAHIRLGFDQPGDFVAQPGRCVITLDNASRRFSPGYASGVYTNLLPRRPVRVTATSGETTWTLFRGYIEHIDPDGGTWSDRGCVLTCVDGVHVIQQAKVGVAHESTKAVDEAVAAIVSAAYTPVDTEYSDNGDSLSHYGRAWTPDHTSARQALRDICEAVYGRFFVQRDGTATYLSRNDLLDASVSSSLDVEE